MRKVLEQRAVLQGLEDEVESLRAQLRRAVEEQARIRQNIDRVPRDSEIYKRYLAKFDAQEAQIDKIQGALEPKETAWRQKQREYGEFLEGVNAD
jgi:chromosome segregation ATPase